MQKQYDERASRILKDELDNLEKLLSKSALFPLKLKNLYSAYPEEVKKHILPIDLSDEDYVEEWTNEPYKGKELPPDIPAYITNRKEQVRSKSELNIANMLEKYGIPYKYECPLVLSNGMVIHPDFTVLNVKRREVFYWEHRGMMDDREYAKHAVQRVKMLAREGIVIGDSLIITEETQNAPLGTDEIECVIRRLLL